LIHWPGSAKIFKKKETVIQIIIHTSIILVITMGKNESGNLNILNSVMQTNAVCASNLLLLSISKKVVNETNVTLNFKFKFMD
jgi:hypothetical protein